MGLFSWAVMGGVCTAILLAIRAIVRHHRSGDCVGCSCCKGSACAGCSTKTGGSETPQA